MFASFFPEYKEKRIAVIDLDAEARLAVENDLYPSIDPKSFSEPIFCTRFVTDLHQRRGLDASFGGYLEDRAFLWQGTYLGGTERALHLGIDFNVPPGATVTTPYVGTVVLVDDDTPERCGWGPRVFLARDELQPAGDLVRYVYIFAHLANIQVVVGDTCNSGSIIGTVGAPPHNGNWYPHLHVQKVLGTVFERYAGSNLRLLDGYGLRSEVDTLPLDFPDPLDIFLG
jgi:murein DD-endopeptidase MepM/ murein hydrolase activator NlpD